MKNVLLIMILSVGLIACEEGANNELPIPGLVTGEFEEITTPGIEGLEYLVDYDYVGGPEEVEIGESGADQLFHATPSTGTFYEICGKDFFVSNATGNMFGSFKDSVSGLIAAKQLGTYEYDHALGGFQTLSYKPAVTLVAGRNVDISSLSASFQAEYGHLPVVIDERPIADDCLIIVDESNQQLDLVLLLTSRLHNIF